MSSLNTSKNQKHVIKQKKFRPINLTSINFPCDFIFANKINHIALSYLSVGQKIHEAKKKSNLSSQNKNMFYTITNPKIINSSSNNENYNSLKSNKTINNMNRKKIKILKKKNSLVTNSIFKESNSKNKKKYISPTGQCFKNKNNSYKSLNKIPIFNVRHKNKINHFKNKENKCKIKIFSKNFFDKRSNFSSLFLNNNKTLTNRNDKFLKRNTEPNRLKINDYIFYSKNISKNDLISSVSINNSIIERNVKNPLKCKKIKNENLTNLFGSKDKLKKIDGIHKTKGSMIQLNRSKERKNFSKKKNNISKKLQLKKIRPTISQNMKEKYRNKKLSFISTDSQEYQSKISKRNLRDNYQELLQKMKNQKIKYKNSVKTDDDLKTKANNMSISFNHNSCQFFNKIKNNKNYCNNKSYKNQTDIDFNNICYDEKNKINKKILSIDFNKFIKVNLLKNKIAKMKPIKKCLFNEIKAKKIKIKREIMKNEKNFFYKDNIKTIKNILFDENNLENINNVDEKFDDIYAIIKIIGFRHEKLKDESIFNVNADAYKKYRNSFDKFFDKNYNRKNKEFVYCSNIKQNKKKDKCKINNNTSSTKGGSSNTKGFRSGLKNRL